jgi:hypothetical protein
MQMEVNSIGECERSLCDNGQLVQGVERSDTVTPHSQGDTKAMKLLRLARIVSSGVLLLAAGVGTASVAPGAYTGYVLQPDAFKHYVDSFNQDDDESVVNHNGAVVPWIDESLNPDTGAWITNNKDRGKDYNHSTYCDLIISGLVGLRPRPDNVLDVNPLVPEGKWNYFCLDNVLYHGRTLAIFWDATGQKYGHGAGLHAWADGVELASSRMLARLHVTLAASRPVPPTPQ